MIIAVEKRIFALLCFADFVCLQTCLFENDNKPTPWEVVSDVKKINSAVPECALGTVACIGAPCIVVLCAPALSV
jgi:hypothetical protein